MNGDNMMKLKKITAALAAAVFAAALPLNAFAADKCRVTFDSNGVEYSFPSYDAEKGIALVYNEGFNANRYVYVSDDSWDHITVGNMVIDRWYYDKQCTRGFDFLNDKITADTTLYANWARAIKSVSVNFSPNTSGQTVKAVINSNISLTSADPGYTINREDCVIYDPVKKAVMNDDDVLKDGERYSIIIGFRELYDVQYDRADSMFIEDGEFKTFVNGADLTDNGYGDEHIYFSFIARGYRLGDINNDNSVNTQDAMLSVRFAKKLAAPANDRQKHSADVNGDSALDTKDAMKIINAARNKGDAFSELLEPVYF